MKKGRRNAEEQNLYIMQNGKNKEYKIGITGDLTQRRAELQTGCPYELRIIKVWTHYDRKKIQHYETTIHRFYRHQKLRKDGEWFKLTDIQLEELCKPNSIEEQDALIADYEDLI